MSEQAQITIRRTKNYADRLRAYKISIDGQTVATVKAGDSVSVPVAVGKHTIRMRIDWCGSEEMEFEARPGEQIVFECSSNLPGMRMFLALYYLIFEPRNYLLLRRVS